MQEMLDYLREINVVSITFRIMLAILIGGIMGLERGRKNRPAGLRTHILVCLGAALVMMTNQYVYVAFNASDPVRLGAQVISGIGFLGAGTIIVTGNSQIKGLTTAAGLWTAACIGLAVGIGFYEGAVIGGGAIMFAVSGLNKIGILIHQKSRYMELYIEYDKSNNTLSDFLDYAKQNQIEVTDIQLNGTGARSNNSKKIKTISYVLTVKSKTKRTHAELIEILTKADGMRYIVEL